jgi:hypothetical protein
VVNGGQNFDRHHRFVGAAKSPTQFASQAASTARKFHEGFGSWDFRANPVGTGVPVPAPPIAHPRTMLDAVGTFEKVFP